MINTELTLLNLIEASQEGEGEILAVFDRENNIGDNEEAYGSDWNIHEMLEVLSPYGSQKKPTLAGIEIEEIKHWGGEGEGDSIGFVFKHGETYVEVHGYYSSYGGSEYGDASVTEVEPREVTVIKYLPKDSK